MKWIHLPILILHWYIYIYDIFSYRKRNFHMTSATHQAQPHVCLSKENLNIFILIIAIIIVTFMITINIVLTHFSPMFHFYTRWERQKIKVFLRLVKKLWILSHLLKKSLTENFNFCAVLFMKKTKHFSVHLKVIHT